MSDGLEDLRRLEHDLKSQTATVPKPRRTLYEIDADLLALDSLLDEIGGDVSDPTVAAAIDAWYAELAYDEAKKLDGWVNWIRQMEMESAAARAEAEQYARRAQTRDRTIAWAKGVMKSRLEGSARTEVETATGRIISVQKNGGRVPVLLVDGLRVDDLPDQFVRVVREIDSEKVRAELEAGGVLTFARLGERGTQLRIR